MNANNPLIIFGSSRSDGDTFRALQTIFKNLPQIPMVDLNDLSISYYDYLGRNVNDDFLPLAEKMVLHNPLILATPVYWYTMSAIMKTFLDRWTDLLDVKKEIGRQLRGKSLFIIAVHQGQSKGFEEAFSQTAEYMGMKYGGCFYYHAKPDDIAEQSNKSNLEFFLAKLLSTS
jgi:multimeric flavodoxin WrbA